MKRAIVVVAFAAFGCDAILGPDPSPGNASVFDVVWKDLDRHYAFFELKQIDWQVKRDLYRPQALAATTSPQLAQVIAKMFVDLADVHVNLYVGNTAYGDTSYKSRPYYFDTQVIFKSPYVSSSALTASKNMRHGMMGNTSLVYVWMPTLGGTGWDGDMDAIIAAHPGATGLILDIRDNGGGSNRTGKAISGRFAGEKVLYSYSRMRSGPGHGDFTGYYASYIERGGAQHFDGPIVVLTSRRNFSAAEEFVLGMRLLPSVTVVGDTTGGGMGSPVFRELPNGWTYRFSEGMVFDDQKVSYELTGIPPGVFVRQDSASTASGIDAVLEKACEILGVLRCGRP
jgi:hypothetical protein